MSIESFLHPERIDIARLIVENPEPTQDIFFDAERDLTEKDWQEIKTELESYRKDKDWWKFSWLASNIALISPARRAEIELDDDAWQGMLDVLSALMSNNATGATTDQVLRMKILFPQRKAELEITKEDWQEIINGFEQCKKNMTGCLCLVMH